MSSYLTFYLVPKDTESSNKKPLALMHYSRNSDVYQAFYDNIHPAFIGNGDTSNYTELTEKSISFIVRKLKGDLEEYRRISEAKIKALKELPKLEGEALREYLQETASTQEYLQDLEYNLHQMEFIENIVCDLKYSDFEKILINID